MTAWRNCPACAGFGLVGLARGGLAMQAVLVVCGVCEGAGRILRDRFGRRRP